MRCSIILPCCQFFLANFWNKKDWYRASKIDFTLVPFFQEQHIYFSVMLFLTNNSNSWINIQYNCLSVPFVPFFCNQYLQYVCLMHTMGYGSLNPNSHIKLKIASFFFRLTLVSPGFCFLSLSSLPCFSSQLAELHVNMVKKNQARCECPWWKRAK